MEATPPLACQQLILLAEKQRWNTFDSTSALADAFVRRRQWLLRRKIAENGFYVKSLLWVLSVE